MRPVRFVALSEDGQALVLADEVGRLLSLPIDERISTALDPERAANPNSVTIAAVPYDASNGTMRTSSGSISVMKIAQKIRLRPG